jgi:FkbM family methyltransferase
VSDAADFEVLREVFLDREYELDLDWEPELILDVGSNIGAAIAFFRARYPAARIVGLEPDPRAFARLQANVGGFDGVTLLKVAAAATNGRRPFYPATSTWLSSLHRPARTREEPIEVETRTIDSLLGELGVDDVDLLKIDVEGAEAEILPGFAGLANVRAVVGEIHPDVVRDPAALVRLLEERFDLQVLRPQPDRWRFKGVVLPSSRVRRGRA